MGAANFCFFVRDLWSVANLFLHFSVQQLTPQLSELWLRRKRELFVRLEDAMITGTIENFTYNRSVF